MKARLHTRVNLVDHRRAAFTLAEMLVVLLILSALAFVAVESLRPVASQTRFEATQRTLESVRRAIVAESDPGGSTFAVRGFIADTGRFPRSLTELLVLPVDLTPTDTNVPVFGLRPGPGIYSSVMAPGGWRGPYLTLPPGATNAEQVLRDGWGSALASVPATDWSSTTGPVTILSPVTTDRLDSSPEYAMELSVTIRPEDWQPALIAGSLYRLDGGVRAPPSITGTWGVALLGPGPNGGVSVINATISSAPTGEVAYSFLGGPGSGLTMGPRVLQATLNNALIGRPVYLQLQGGGTYVMDLLVE